MASLFSGIRVTTFSLPQTLPGSRVSGMRLCKELGALKDIWGAWAERSQEEAYPTTQVPQAIPMVSQPLMIPTRTLPGCLCLIPTRQPCRHLLGLSLETAGGFCAFTCRE